MIVLAKALLILLAPSSSLLMDAGSGVIFGLLDFSKLLVFLLATRYLVPVGVELAEEQLDGLFIAMSLLSLRQLLLLQYELEEGLIHSFRLNGLLFVNVITMVNYLISTLDRSLTEITLGLRINAYIHVVIDNLFFTH
jgi:hypothetical protein